jgi:malate dehydrogenase (oxaloacetate-decarboxylating)(NADP+)
MSTDKRGIELLRDPSLNIQTAARVAKLVFDAGLARVKRPADMVSFIREHVYKPEYATQAARKPKPATRVA